MSGRDDDALSWGGDDDPTLEDGVRRDARAGAPDAAVEPGEAAERDAEHAAREHDTEADPASAVASGEAEDDAPAAMGNAALIAFGVLGGVYALYVVGWAVGGFRLRDQIEAGGQVADVMFQAALWLGMLSPVIWFLVTLYLTRGAPMWRRFAGLGLGVLLLVPWPFVMMGAIGR